MNERRFTDFGFNTVSPDEKTRRVRAVFESVAGRYDLMNDLMSLGVHRLWKRAAVRRLALRRGARVLDVAAGTGDLTRLMLNRVGDQGRVVMTDINAAMLTAGRDRLIDAGCVERVAYVQANAEELPFAPSTFDAVVIAFGLRNVTDKQAALAEFERCLRPGGRLVILEFSKVVIPLLAKLYDLYSFEIIPRLGRFVTGDAESYQYLVESIRRHPEQRVLSGMMETAGLANVGFDNLSAGVVAIHRGFKF